MPSGLKSEFLGVGVAIVTLLATACSEAPNAPVSQNTQSPRSTSASLGVREGPSTLQWNAKAIELAGRRSIRNPLANRAYMLLSVAEARALDALSIEARTSPDIDLGVTSRAAALGGAAASVLAYLFPADIAEVEAIIDAMRGSAPNAGRFDAALASGRAAGQGVVAAALTDGSSAVVVPVVPVGPGFWIPTPVIVTPQWPLVRPMLMSSGSQFRPGPPPAFNSPVFLAALQRVRDFSDNRTAEQLAILNFWNDPIPVGGHGAHWNRIAVELILAEHLTESRAVHVLESLNLAISDATIACFDAKYTYWYVRPYQVDPLITTPLGQPGHAAYPSQHSCQGGAAVGVLQHEFPHSAASLEAMLSEMNLSREWAGLHYWFDTEVGANMGRQVAGLANAPR